MATQHLSLEHFLQPLAIDVRKCHGLARSLDTTFRRLARDSEEQFLPTPISDAILRPQEDGEGRYLAIDIGGTNLRVGFIELLGPKPNPSKSSTLSNAYNGEGSRVRRHLERSWPIGEQLKNNRAEDLFAWIGKCISEVVRDGCLAWPGELPEEIPLGVTFSFPMVQHTLADATLMAMGKGFAITGKLDLGKSLLQGYESAQTPDLPRVKIKAIVNDAVATLVSFAYQLRSDPRRKAAMGLIVGTGTNATIPLALGKLHPNKRPQKVRVIDGAQSDSDLKITVNSEWTIKGAAQPLHDLHFITEWDAKLDAEGEAPGFQPFEYMTAGRYLGELGRIIIVDYFTTQLSIPESSLPGKLRQRHGLTTIFLGNMGPHLSPFEPDILKQLETELSSSSSDGAFKWTSELADIVFKIAKAIQLRGSGMTAAAILGLLACADEIHFSPPDTTLLMNGNAPHSLPKLDRAIEELLVGYTGGTIVHFQNYLEDCQSFLDDIMNEEFGDREKVRVVLRPCHDGGILGAGILAGTIKSNTRDV